MLGLAWFLEAQRFVGGATRSGVAVLVVLAGRPLEAIRVLVGDGLVVDVRSSGGGVVQLRLVGGQNGGVRRLCVMLLRSMWLLLVRQTLILLMLLGLDVGGREAIVVLQTIIGRDDGREFFFVTVDVTRTAGRNLNGPLNECINYISD